MPTFKYVAKNETGKKMTGKISAQDKEDATGQLRRQNLTVVSVKKEGGGGIVLFGGTPRPKVKSQDMVVFTRQFATMIGSGIPILECIDILKDQAQDPGFKACLENIIEKVRAGTDLSVALAEYPKVFPRIYCNMIKAGEASGQLEAILDRLAGYQEASESLKREIKSAMTYPVVSLVMVVAITIGLLVGIIPKFKDIFLGLGVELPPLTVFVLAISDGLQTYFIEGFFLIAFVIVACILFKKKTKVGAYFFDWLSLKIPIFGPLIQKVAISRFARTFSTLIKSGVPILGALEIVMNTSSNVLLMQAVDDSRESIRQGDALAKPLANYSIFPPMVVRMIAIGEKSGALEALLTKISEFYDEQVSATVESLTSLIEPIMIGMMGFMVGGIVLSVFLPILKLQSQLSGGG